VCDGLNRLSKLSRWGLDTHSPLLWTDEQTTRPPSGPGTGETAGTPQTRKAKQPSSTHTPRYLSAETPSVLEAISGFERRPTREKAVARIAELTVGMTLAREPLGSGDSEEPVVWIMGFDVSPKELSKGYRGNYARLSPRRLDDGAWTVFVEKIDVELARHPSRGRRPRYHPNWGHPILRGAQGNPRQPNRSPRVYATRAAAQHELAQLKREFPEAAILNDGLLFIMVFSRTQQPPIQRIRILIRPHGNGYILSVQSNEKPPNGTQPKVAKSKDTESNENQQQEPR